MNGQIACQHCQRWFDPNPRVKNQRFCGRPACQRARKTAWEREKLHNDPDYQQNRRESQRKWRVKNPDYWSKYRIRNPASAERNRLLEQVRKARRRVSVAKMDALRSIKDLGGGSYYLVPLVAKMDASPVKAYVIPIH